MECKKFDDDDNWETIQETGIITCFDPTTCKAIIDRKYLFYTNNFPSANCAMQCGTKVWFTAQRSERNPQWQLTSLEIYESNQEGLKQKMGKGKTTLPSILQNASQNDGVLNSNRADDDDDDWMVDDLGEHIISAHKALLENKFKIKITPMVIRFPSLTTGASAKKTIKIYNDSEHLVRLKQISFIRDPCISNFEFNLADKVSMDGCILLLPNSEMPLELTCQAMLIGMTTELCIFDFGSFQIGRMVIVLSKSEVEKEMESSFVERADTAGKSAVEMSQIIKDHARTPIKSSHRVRSSFFLQNPLPAYEITPEMWRFLEFKDENLLRQCYPKALDVLQYDTYKEKFGVFLWIEEMECHRMRRQYDMKDVILTKCQNGYYTFKAPRIQDIQPPVNISDILDVFNPANPSDYRYEGIIKDLCRNKVTCVFGSLFDAQYTGFPLTVQFRLGRNIYRRCHFAVETAAELLGESFLFPESEFEVKNPRIVVIEDELGQNENSVDLQQQEMEAVAPAQNIFSDTVFTHQKSMARFMSSPASSENCGKRLNNNLFSRRSVSATVSEPSSNNFRLRWFNNKLNEEQRNAVRRILRGQARPLPYIIYGPPGTGKTVTLVEAIMQVNKLDKNSRILVCAPSNSAADIVAEYLANSNIYHPGDFLRLNGFLRSQRAIPESVAPFCVDGEDLGNVVKHRFIISTCSTAGQFFNLDLSDGHFTHVFVDEAGYCTEPETMIAAVLLSLTKGGQLILAGDPKQLGAVLMSPVAKNGRLNMSFLERLMTRRLYRRDVKRFPEEKYNPLVLTMLVRNYRSHPTLLKLPSQLFYDADLLPAASYKETHELCQLPNLKELLAPGVPLLFHGVHGTCSRERGSTSSFNIAEACQVAQYVIGLMNDGGLKSEDIGIITPYRKQVEKIRHTLEGVLTANVEIPKVASVEEFQGGERKVIIISTVRSYNEDQVEKHLDHLSFVYDPKRYNVATTRAKALMIVVGNPHLLSHNSYWLKLLKYCIELKAYKGCNLPINLCPNIRKFVVEKEREEIEGAVSTLGGRQYETNLADQIDSFKDLILDDPEPDDTW